MGSVGPKLEDVYQSGCDMTEYFLDNNVLLVYNALNAD